MADDPDGPVDGPGDDAGDDTGDDADEREEREERVEPAEDVDDRAPDDVDRAAGAGERDTTGDGTATGARAATGEGAATKEDRGERVEDLREAVERSRSGAPAVGSVVRDRFSADEVFQRIIAAADEEITSGSRELYFSGFAAGLAITITVLLYASLTAATDGDPVFSAMLYPLGFLYIIIGGYQLYTENTLPPVLLTLERLASLPALLRNWALVLAGNFSGGVVGAAVLAYTGVFDRDARLAAVDLSQKGVETGTVDLFFKAAIAGLIVAGVVWLNYASRDTISRVVLVYLAFLAIPLGNLFHVVVSFTEMTFLVLHGELAVLVGLTDFVIPVLAGNTVGGVALVTVVNYFQTSAHRLETARFEGAQRQLSRSEWLLGGFIGRSYVPLLDTMEDEAAGTEQIVVPIANPRTETGTVQFAAALASQRPAATLQVVHIVHAPERRAAQYSGRQSSAITQASERQLAAMLDDIEDYDVPIRTSTIISHRSLEKVVDSAKHRNADLLVVGWDESRPWAMDRPQGSLEELTSDVPCDIVVYKDRGFDPSRLLLPTKGGPGSELGAEVARAFQAVADAEVTLLRVVDGSAEREMGEQFLAEWAADNDLEDAVVEVDESGDVEAAIERLAAQHSMLLMGATERGVISRLLSGSLHFKVVEDVDCSVVIAERPARRSLLQRLFGRN